MITKKWQCRLSNKKTSPRNERGYTMNKAEQVSIKPTGFKAPEPRLALAILLKCADQVMGYHLSGASFYLVALDEMHQLPIFKKSDGR